MIDVLGLELNLAIDMLRQQNFNVLTTEVRSKKGVSSANEARVIRQRLIDEKTVELAYALFMTNCK